MINVVIAKAGLDILFNGMYFPTNNDKGKNDRNNKSQKQIRVRGCKKLSGNHKPEADNKEPYFTMVWFGDLVKNNNNDKLESKNKILCFKWMLSIQKGIQLKVVLS